MSDRTSSSVTFNRFQLMEWIRAGDLDRPEIQMFYRFALSEKPDLSFDDFVADLVNRLGGSN